MMSAYVRTNAPTDFGGSRGKTQKGRGDPDMYLAFSLGLKLTSLGVTNGVATVSLKNF